MSKTTLHLGDCLNVLKSIPDNSVDSIVTDPPYGINFMNKGWDNQVPGVDVWTECLRVLKPGGHLLAFAGTRTQHRMATRIEDAGFEIRDMIAWVYGSGFPKSLDVSKAIDKNNGEPNRLHKFTEFMRTTGVTARELNDITGTSMGSHYLTDKSQPAIPTPELWVKIRPLIKYVPLWVDELVDRIEAEREVISASSDRRGDGTVYGVGHSGKLTSSTAITSAAKQWNGWGTALKPALEPITVARKPFAGTVANNVLQHGTGAINIDGCRVGNEVRFDAPAGNKPNGSSLRTSLTGMPNDADGSTVEGRFPANLIHDGSDEVVELFPGVDDKSAARFFYCPKASKKDRDDGLDGFDKKESEEWPQSGVKEGAKRGASPRANIHPTVKPTDLMAYLCRLVTPPGGTVLDPFMGSGSTGKAAVREGFNFIGIELDETYFNIAQARINGAKS